MPKLILFAVVTAALCGAASAMAQPYPVRPIRIVIPFPPGSGADILARAVGAKLTERWGQQVLTDSRPGASGVIASEVVLKAPADGYTLMLGTSSSHAINVSLRQKLPYHPVRDFAPVSLVAFVPLLLMAHPSVPVKSAQDLISFAKARPGRLTFASAGTGTTAHLAGELFKSMAGIDMVHVPYKGSPQALLDTVSGQVSLVFAPILTGLPHARAGKLKALAVTTPRRYSSTPDVPALAEGAVPGYEATVWYGLFVPAGTPREIVARLNGEIVAILGLSDVRESLKQQGADAAGNSPEEFAAHVKSEIAKWARVLKSAGIRAE